MPEGRPLERIRPRSPPLPGTPFSGAAGEAIGYDPHHDARAPRPSMTPHELADRVHGLCLLADRLRAPGHRHTPEDYVADRDEIRDHARRLYRDLTGAWPAHEAGAAGPARRPELPVPAAIERHRERARALRPA